MKTRIHFAIAGLLFVIALVLPGCGNFMGPEETASPSQSNGNTDSSGGGIDNTVPGDTDRLYFIKTSEQSESGGTLCFLPSGSARIYTFPNKSMTSYAVNRERSKIVFAEILSGYSGSYLAFMNTDGTSYTQSYIRGSNPSFNSAGDIVYFDDEGKLYSMNTEGGGKQELAVPGVEGTKRFPRLSPDGRKLAFYQSSPGYKWYYDDVVFLYVYDLDTGELLKLNENSVPVSCLNWSPDGSEIAFSTSTGITPPVRDLWTVKADGSAQPQRISESGSPASGACGFPSYTADGFILCGSTKNGILNWRSSWDGSHYKYELAKIKPDGTSLVILVSGYSIKDPLWVQAG